MPPRSIILVALLLWLGGCSLLHRAPPMSGPGRDPAALLDWTAEGKLGLHYQDKGGSLYFTWQQTGDRFDLSLSGPLGQGHTRLAGDSQHVSMDNTSTGHLEAATPETLMQRALGWQAPVSHLRYWLRGLPATAGATVRRAADGRVSEISEDGWQADYERYDDAPPYRLPGKLVITGPDTRLVVVVSTWTPAP